MKFLSCFSRAHVRQLILTSALAVSAGAHAQTLQWAQFVSAVPFGSGAATPSQSLPAAVPGAGRGSGVATLVMSVAGGTASWNGYGVGRNDDGYFPAPDLPQVGITYVSGAPGYLGGVPLAAQAAFSAAYNSAGAPVGLAVPTSDRAAVYADSGTGTTLSAQWDFSTLNGGKLPAGSWIFLDGIDQGERVTVTGPNGWISTVHTGDSTLPRAPNGMTTLVSAPTFPSCAPAITTSANSIEFNGRYGDVSQFVPGCSNTPVPVAGQTVGYTKGIDSVGVWVRTDVDLTSLSITAFDTDISPPNAPDNNYVLGFGLIAATYAPPPIPGPTGLWLVLLGVMVLLIRSYVLRRAMSSR